MDTITTADFNQIAYRSTMYSKQPRGSSPWERFSQAIVNVPMNATYLYDDFEDNNTTKTTDIWQIVKGTGQAITLAGPGSSNANGWMSIPTAASSANDYQTLWTNTAQYSLSAACPIAFEVYVNVTEANTNKASWFAGLSSTTTTGFLQNSGAPASSYSGAMFWKATGALSLSFQTSNATTQNSATGLATVVSGQSYILGCFLDPNDGVTALANYYVATVSGSPKSVTVLASGTQNLAFASIAAMYFGFGIKCGSASAETLMIDYAQVESSRVLV